MVQDGEMPRYGLEHRFAQKCVIASSVSASQSPDQLQDQWRLPHDEIVRNESFGRTDDYGLNVLTLNRPRHRHAGVIFPQTCVIYVNFTNLREDSF